MSISDEIVNRVSEGRLVPVQHSSAVPAPLRFMFITREIAEEIKTPRNGDFTRWQQLRADLVAFTLAQFICAADLWLLSPVRDGVWEIKSHDKPEIRVFGQFAIRNVFIALTFCYREDLGRLDDPGWRFEIRRAKSQWKKLFSSFDALMSEHVDALFTGAIDEKYFKD